MSAEDFSLTTVEERYVDAEAESIGKLYRLGGSGLVDSAKAYIECGQRLIAQKARMRHGEWLPWLKQHEAALGFGINAAGRLMKGARECPNSEFTQNLDPEEAAEMVRQIWGNKSKEKQPDGDEWFTPAWLFDALGLAFDLDVCSPADREHVAVPAERFFTEADNGLDQPWEGLVWCNPPYSSPEPWANRMCEHGDGLLLTHVPINAEWCARVWQECSGVRLFQAMEFVRPDGSVQRPGYWLMLAAFGERAADSLSRLSIPGSVTNPRQIPSPMLVRHAS